MMIITGDKQKSRLAGRFSHFSPTSDGEAADVVLASLEEDYGYPKQWLAEHACSCEVGLSKLSHLSGVVLFSRKKKPFFVIVFRDRGEIPSPKTLAEVMVAYPTISFGGILCENASGLKFLRKNFYSQELEYVADMERVSGDYRLKPGQLFAEAEKLVPLTSNIENIFFEIHSHLRDIDGLHPDDALDELCKIIYAKLYDEEISSSAPLRFQSNYISNEELASSIRDLYQEACDYDMRVFRLKIPQYDRSRGVFNSPIRLSTTALRRTVETLEGFALGASSADVKGRAFQKVLDRAVRHGMGQFFTPEPVVDLMVAVCDPLLTDLILDPFCGSAHFLSRSLEHVRTAASNKNEKLFHEFAFGKLHGIEKSDRMVRIAMTDMRLHGDGHSNIRCTDSLSDFANFADLSPASFDLILTNPPFGSLLGADSVRRLGNFELGLEKKNVPLEILGIERCVHFLRPGGRIAIVLPDGVFSSKKNDYVREWLANAVKVRAIASLPPEAFTPFGANVKTSVLFARKWEVGETRTTDYNIFMCRIESLGYDAAGRPKDESDVPAAVKALLNFFSREGW